MKKIILSFVLSGALLGTIGAQEAQLNHENAQEPFQPSYGLLTKENIVIDEKSTKGMFDAVFQKKQKPSEKLVALIQEYPKTTAAIIATTIVAIGGATAVYFCRKKHA